uniref:Structural maintenance of chromosomes protein 6 n=1 Tax=Aegilops tauschii TaxID=37682 RepID=M8AXK8_AEGTA
MAQPNIRSSMLETASYCSAACGCLLSFNYHSLQILTVIFFVSDSVNETGHRASANDELELIKRKLDAAEQEKAHYEGLMTTKVLPAIKMAEAEYADLQQLRQMVFQDGPEPPNSCFLGIFLEKDNFKKASTICPESDMEALNNVAGSTPEQLSATLNRLKQRFDQESRSDNNLSTHAESIDDLRALHDKKEQKILSNSFETFNEHLGKKGISGFTNVDYQNKVLSIELTMPQDASHDTIRDTRGLSGGERSFSTLCFALALHGMTEAPFRAMDEFDVFMDAVSRKISLDTLVDFAVAHGSQWIFITPHDISMVKPGDRVKKQQLAAPRG